MSWAHPEFKEYATCIKCGLKKSCKLSDGRFVCFSCDSGNFNGLRKIMKEQETRK